MKEANLLGKNLPSHPDVLPILEESREKYEFPHCNEFDQNVASSYGIFL